MEAIKVALEAQFDYLDYLLTYKYVKDQVVVIMKGRQGQLKKLIEKGGSQPRNCPKAHWNQLKEVLLQEETIKRVD
jgi:hypothetical protein